MAKQATLILIKPDGLQKSLTGNVLTKLAEARLVIIGAKAVKVNEELARAHYAHLQDKPFFAELIRYIQGGVHGEPYNRVVAFVYMGDDATQKVRKIVGATNPEEADPVSIRGSYGRILTSGIFENVVHASSDPGEAEREIKLWFKPEELTDDLYGSWKSLVKVGR
ncbi:nucleoside-diphosphate kinase [Elusimicrobiota bacterium]